MGLPLGLPEQGVCLEWSVHSEEAGVSTAE